MEIRSFLGVMCWRAVLHGFSLSLVAFVCILSSSPCFGLDGGASVPESAHDTVKIFFAPGAGIGTGSVIEYPRCHITAAHVAYKLENRRGGENFSFPYERYQDFQSDAEGSQKGGSSRAFVVGTTKFRNQQPSIRGLRINQVMRNYQFLKSFATHPWYLVGGRDVRGNQSDLAVVWTTGFEGRDPRGVDFTTRRESMPIAVAPFSTVAGLKKGTPVDVWGYGANSRGDEGGALLTGKMGFSEFQPINFIMVLHRLRNLTTRVQPGDSGGPTTYRGELVGVHGAIWYWWESFVDAVPQAIDRSLRLGHDAHNGVWLRDAIQVTCGKTVEFAIHYEGNRRPAPGKEASIVGLVSPEQEYQGVVPAPRFTLNSTIDTSREVVFGSDGVTPGFTESLDDDSVEILHDAHMSKPLPQGAVTTKRSPQSLSVTVSVPAGFTFRDWISVKDSTCPCAKQGRTCRIPYEKVGRYTNTISQDTSLCIARLRKLGTSRDDDGGGSVPGLPRM
jgi:hypothetical protein